MSFVCRSVDALAEALLREESEIIVVDSELKGCIRRFKAISDFVWLIIIAAVAFVIIGLFISPGFGTFFWFTFAAILIILLFMGVQTSMFAFKLAFSAGGVGVLHKLREYDASVTNKGSLRLVL